MAARRAGWSTVPRLGHRNGGEMVNGEERLYQRLEALERTYERHSALLQELQRRMDGVEEMRDDLRRVEQALTRLEGRLETILGRMQTWQAIVWALLIMLISGIVAAGFDLMRR
jgi:predicted nuclease with TOPRIM domain